eukprot:1531912-Rhodomonas_salina.1
MSGTGPYGAGRYQHTLGQYWRWGRGVPVCSKASSRKRGVTGCARPAPVRYLSTGHRVACS